MTTTYQDFIRNKTQLDGMFGFDPVFDAGFLFPFQRALTDWAVRQGRGAVFADCGLGKTPIQLAWAQNVVRKEGPVLVLTPLAVSWQTCEEGEKFGIEAVYSKDGRRKGDLTVTNYDRLHLFDRDDYAGVVCDESSCIKSFDGVRRAMVTDFMRHMKYRLLCTATAAPNDYTELGTSSEALGHLGHTDMLGRFFKNDQNTVRPMVYRHKGQNFAKLDERAKWRFKGHAEDPFWRWVCSWARAVRKPSDLGFSDDGFALPELVQRIHCVQARNPRPDLLFDVPAIGMTEEREEARRTVAERCEMVAELIKTDEPAVAWCHLNDEGDLLTKLIPGAVQVKGGDSIEAKEEAFHAFSKGQVRVIVTKPKIGAWGLNWQHCRHMTFFPSHSYEQYYQAVRRCWRFGQTMPVTVDIVSTEGGEAALSNLKRKSAQADRMFDRLVGHMNDSLRLERASDHTMDPEIPTWL